MLPETANKIFLPESVVNVGSFSSAQRRPIKKKDPNRSKPAGIIYDYVQCFGLLLFVFFEAVVHLSIVKLMQGDDAGVGKALIELGDFNLLFVLVDLL